MPKALSTPLVILGVVLFTPITMIALSIFGIISAIVRPFFTWTKEIFVHFAHHESHHVKAT
jgi:hypothetical protein